MKIDSSNRNLSVVILVTNIDAPTGGVQKNTRLLLREFNKRGIATFACIRNYYRLPSNETIDGTVVHRSPVCGNSMLLNGVLYFVDTIVWLIRNRSRYDVIQCQQMFGPTMAAAAASFLVRKPIVTRVTTSGTLGEVFHIRKMAFARLRLWLIRRVSIWVALTGDMAREIETLGVGRKNIRVIHNSTTIPDTTAFDDRAKLGQRTRLGLPGVKIGVFAGRLSEEKNLDVLINAWGLIAQRHPDALLLLIGEGGEFRNVESSLRDQVARMGLGDNVIFNGYVERPVEFLLASDVFVLPSRTEGMSNSLVEAFACGCAIVASDIPANTEICKHRVNSLTVAAGDPVSLADAVITIFESPELAKGLRIEARRLAEMKLSVDTMVDKYLATYVELVK